ncbi:MAG: Hsp20/alpha crystallin family protein [candidate division WOR-3 bacterium]
MGNIFDEIKKFEREMDLLLNDFMNSVRGIPYKWGWHPLINIFEKEDSLIVLVEAAGVKCEDIKITIEGRILTISGKRKDPFSEENRRFFSMEIPFGSFERRIKLPYPITEPEKAMVRKEEGFIQIILPKTPEKEKIIEIE